MTAVDHRGHMAEPTMAARLRSIMGGSVGNLIEWYDWYVYSYFSLYFAKAFFPAGDETAQLLNTAAVFAVGFLMRPIGGWIMGYYADRYGRKTALTGSVLLMCFGSLVIAIVPTYAAIGVWSPTILVLARMVQGVSVGGEYGTSATYLSEMATQKARGFYSSFQYVTLIMGQLLAILVLVVLQRVMGAADLDAWGWRIPFLVGAAGSLVALWLRRRLTETHSFTQSQAQTAKTKVKPMTLLLGHPKAVLTVIGLTMGGTVAFYTYSTYMPKFLVNTVHLTKDDSTLVSTFSLLFFMLLQPVVGALSDRIGRRPLLIGFGILGTLGTVPLMTALSGVHDSLSAFLLIILALTVVSGYTAINAVVKAELFPAEIRALGVGLPYAIAVSVFGGSAEYIALKFKEIGHEPWFYWYATACIAGSLAVYLFMPDTKKTSLIDREQAG